MSGHLLAKGTNCSSKKRERCLAKKVFVCELLGYVFQAIRRADTTDAIHVNNDHKMPGETRITSKSTACLKVETAETNVQKACTKQSDLRLISCKKRIQAPSERRMQSITLILMASERKLRSSQTPGRKRRKENFFPALPSEHGTWSVNYWKSAKEVKR